MKHNLYYFRVIPLNQTIILSHNPISLSIKREDLLHPHISGNKFRKLKYNITTAKEQNHTQLLTFGGAFSNHIVAVASAGKEFGFQTIGVIRGEELATQIEDNPSLKFAQACGMILEFVSREQYRYKYEKSALEFWRKKYGEFYLLPEGGSNALAVKGCEEILTKADEVFDYVCCAVGTGGTIAGLINSAQPHQKIIGFPALKGDFLPEDIRKFTANKMGELITDYHFGGYGKVTPQLIQFLNDFHDQHHIPLDPIYTGKMVFGVMDLIEKNYFKKGSNILLIHTGGLQGIRGINKILSQKNQQQITYYG
jgi:1-aminocyclopropane-1-carboxylate deaminase